MPTTLMDLASPAFLQLAAFRRKLRRGMEPDPETARDEWVSLFEELNEKSLIEPGLSDAWQEATEPLIYLIDEVMINTNWSGRTWWEDNDLETDPGLLGHSQKLRGVLFYEKLEEAKKTFDAAERLGRQDFEFLEDLLGIYYACLRFGFKGKFANDPHELEREADQLLAKLPSYGRTRAKEFFEDAYKHTVVVAPSYEPLMRLATAAIVFVGITIVLFGVHRVMWSQISKSILEAGDRTGTRYLAPAVSQPEGSTDDTLAKG